MSNEVEEAKVIEKSEVPNDLSYSYYVVYNFVKDGSGGAGSKIYHTNCGLTESLMNDMYTNIKSSEDFENVIILNVVRLDGKDAPKYAH